MKMAGRTTNISSIAVTTLPEFLGQVINDINALERCEVHFHDARGKIIATIEGETVDEHVSLFKRIQDIPHVFDAGVMFSCCDDEGDAVENS
jgi:nitrate reductase NapAB chaperone NapD